MIPAPTVVPAPTDSADEGIPAVPSPPSWPPDLWQQEIDWSRAMPALLAGALQLGLILLVTSLFRIDPEDPPLLPER